MKRLTLVLLLTTLGTGRSLAQSVVRDTTLATGDSLVVYFPDATRYLVKVDQPLTRLVTFSLERPAEVVLSTQILAWQPGGSAQYEVYPRRRGNYLLRFAPGLAGTTAHFQITRAPAAPEPAKPRSRYRLGFVLVAGIQRPQYLSRFECGGCATPDPTEFRSVYYSWGREAELQVVLGSAGPLSVGVGATQTHRTSEDEGFAMTVFLEPRWMPITLRPFGTATDVGLSTRLGIVTARRASRSPFVTAPGIIVRQHLGSGAGIEGWTLAAGAYLNILWGKYQEPDHFNPGPQIGTQIDPRFTVQLGFAP